jgi:hypothetical protein
VGVQVPPRTQDYPTANRTWVRRGRAGLEIIVCHYPPGTSKWNKIEHRLFSRIAGNWRGRPLATYQTIINLIANTTTSTGLTVRCELDPNLYPTKIKVTKRERDTIPLRRHEFHGEWNYTITAGRDK